MRLTQYYDEIARCNRCGFCQVACPVFRVTGYETGVARGRLALLRALIEKRTEWSDEIQDPLFTCLACGACTANCFPAVATSDLVFAARSDYLDLVGRKPLHRLLFDHLLPYPRRMRLVMKSIAMSKRSGLSRAAQALGLLRFLGRDFPKAEGIIEQFPDSAFRDVTRPGVLKGKGKGGCIAYFVGCGMDLICTEAAQASLRLLLETAQTVDVMNNCCCGLPAATYGDLPAAQRLARRNLQLFREGGYDAIVTDCSSCAAFLKKYPALFAEDDPARQEAAEAASRVKDLVQVLGANGSSPASLPGESGTLVVTWHDPCHARRGQNLVQEPRRILQSLPGVEFRELAESDWCCGGAGSYSFFHYDLSQKVLDRKIDNVARTGADVVATSCPACLIHLSFGARRKGLPIRVCHISELMATK
jgi:glycolate oxidase iron-sulfur subunit